MFHAAGRVRRGVEEALSKRPALIRSLFAKARDAWQHLHVGAAARWISLARRRPKTHIWKNHKERFGAHLAYFDLRLAPLSPETQQFFLMLGIPYCKATGSRTTGICTLDDPRLPLNRVTSARRFRELK